MTCLLGVDYVLKVMFIWLLVNTAVMSECCEVECCLVVADWAGFGSF
jgi:hypothetical protein